MPTFSLKDFIAFSKKDSSLVWFSQLANAALSIIMGKLVTQLYSPADFGHFALLTTIIFLYTNILFNPIQQFFSVKLNTSEKQETLHAYIWGLLYSNFIFAPVLSVLFYFWGGSKVDCFFLILLSLSQSWASLLVNYYNLERNYVKNAVAILSPSILNIIFILSVLFTHLESGTYLIASLSCANFSVSLFLTLKLVLKFGAPSISTSINRFKKEIPSAFKFSGPLIILGVLNWLISYSDRFFIDLFMTKSDVGIYSANYGLASKVMLLASGPMIVLLRPDIYGSALSAFEKKELILKKIVTYLFWATPLVFSFYLFQNKIGLLFLSSSFEKGFFIFFPISLTYLALTCAQFFELYFYSISKTKYILYVFAIGSATNILLNIILIHWLGFWGACLSNIISSSIQFLFAFYYFKKSEG